MIPVPPVLGATAATPLECDRHLHHQGGWYLRFYWLRTRCFGVSDTMRSWYHTQFLNWDMLRLMPARALHKVSIDGGKQDKGLGRMEKNMCSSPRVAFAKSQCMKLGWMKPVRTYFLDLLPALKSRPPVPSFQDWLRHTVLLSCSIWLSLLQMPQPSTQDTPQYCVSCAFLVSVYIIHVLPRQVHRGNNLNLMLWAVHGPGAVRSDTTSHVLYRNTSVPTGRADTEAVWSIVMTLLHIDIHGMLNTQDVTNGHYWRL